MELIKCINEFLELSKDENEFGERSVIRYRYLLSVYNEFLIEEQKLSTETLVHYMNGVTVEGLFQSLLYYIKTRGVKTEDTANLYLSVIKSFYIYLRDKNFINNSELYISFGLSDSNHGFANRRKLFIQELIQKDIIKYSSKGRPLNDKEIKALIKYCNNCISDFEIEEIANNYNKFNRFVYSLITKLIIYIGISVKTIKEICLKDINLIKGTINISGYTVHMPFTIRQNFEKYSEIRKLKKNNNPSLFINYYNKTIDSNTPIGTFISNTLSNFDELNKKSSLISVAKYAIIGMINVDIDRDAIYQITGYKDAVFEVCREIVYLENFEELNKKIDVKMKATDMFDIL